MADIAVPSELLDRVLAEYATHHPHAGDTLVRTAFDFARTAHAGQTRKSGDPFIEHPVSVAEVLASCGLDDVTIAAALLHDVVEDTEVSLDDIREQFGEAVAHLIDGVTKLERIRFGTKAEQQAATIRKMVIAMAKDVRVLFIKLADRLHNVKTIDFMPDDAKLRIARETLEVYAPLAHRLGAQEIKHEMEEICFQILYPGPYAEISEKIRQRSPQRTEVIDEAMSVVRCLLADAGLEGEVTGRPKHHYSIYRKMMKGQSFGEIHDLIGIRIIVADEAACYAALGVVHGKWTPLHGRFKDYIAMSKFNYYQSLHTTVLGPERKPLEVQVRTWDMHERAEYGIAAHWRYKEGVGSEDVPWLADLRSLQEEPMDPEEFLNAMKLDLYDDEVFIFTPAGDVKELPKGATPVDFAYAVHTEVGHRCTGARVNGRLVPLNTELKSGDVVEILTSKKDSGPSRDWAAFVSTSRARNRIKQWFQREHREAAREGGRDQIGELIRKAGLGLNKSQREKALEEVAADLDFKDVASLYQAVGEGGITGALVATRVVRLFQPEESQPDLEPETILEAPRVRRSKQRGVGIVVEGFEDMFSRVARCCSPVPGDDIIGFVTVGRGVSVHRSDCLNIGTFDDARLVDVEWSESLETLFSVWIHVEALDRSWLLRDVTSAISDTGGSILASSSATGRDLVALLRYEVELSDASQIDRVLNELRRVDGVFDAERILPKRRSE